MYWNRPTVRQFDTRFISSLLVVWAVFMYSASTQAGLLDIFWAKRAQSDVLQTPIESGPVSEDTHASADFIAPNEFDNYLHFREVAPPSPGDGRAVISVGTLRAFNLAGVMERDYLFCVDYAPGIAEFNRALARLIVRFERRELLRLLLVDSKPIETSGNKPEHLALRERLAERNESGELARSLTSAVTEDPDLKVVYDFFVHGKDDRPNWKTWVKAFAQFTESAERYEATFFGNQRAYEHLQKLIRSGRFFALTGSLSGHETLRSIGRYLAMRGAVISELDTSNALEHVERAEKNVGMLNFVRNAEELPFAKDGRILVTVDTRFLKPEEKAAFPSIGTWHYAVYSPSSLIPTLKNVAKDSDLIQAYATAGANHPQAPVSCQAIFQPR